MNVSINPWYFCNLNCDFCYLSKEQLQNKSLLRIEDIKKHLEEIEEIKTIDIYGGEVSLIEDNYMIELIEVCKDYTSDISIVTNGTIVKDWMKKEEIHLSISFDGEARDKNEVVFNNLMLLERNYNIIGLVSNKFNIEEFTTLTNILPQTCLSVELKPYSVSDNNENKNLNSKFINNVKYILINSNKSIVNEDRLKLSLSGTYNAFSDEHIYITPNNKIGTLDFKDGKEYFNEYDTFKEYKKKWKETISEDCKDCIFLGKCLTEHYKDNEEKDSCSGFFNLLEWYQEQYFPFFLHYSYKYNKKTQHEDIANNLGFVINEKEDKIKGVRKYITEGYPILTFPIKSIAVSIIYAVLIEKYFNVKKEEVLKYDIFHGTDKYFKKYQDNKKEYDILFKEFEIELNEIEEQKNSKDVKTTISYFKKEYKWN